MRVNRNYTTDDLFTDAEALQDDLVNKNLWKPSDMSPEEQIIAMATNKNQNKKDGNDNKSKGKKRAKENKDRTAPTIKLVKKWKSEGGSNNNSTTSNSNQFVVDQEKLKKGMAALFPNGDFDVDDLAASLVAALRE